MPASASMHRSPGSARSSAPTRRSGRCVALALGLVAVCVLATLAVGESPAGAASRCASTVPGGHVRVVLVVDPGAGGSPGATCLVVPDGTTGADLLAQRGSLLGTAPPRYASSGLLCAIDGYPAEGCGDRTSGGYLYWSYWSGTSGSWVYGQGNPFRRRIRDGDIEGWRFVDGSGTGTDPAPQVAPSPSLFPPLAPPPPAPAPAPDPGAAVPGPSYAPGAPSGGPGAGAAPPSASGAPAAEEPPAATEQVAPDPSAADTTSSSSTTTADGGEDEVQELAVMPASSDGGSGGSAGAVAGVVVVVVLSAGIGAAAVVQSRRRRSEGV
jgi:hypothetical protein